MPKLALYVLWHRGKGRKKRIKMKTYARTPQWNVFFDLFGCWSITWLVIFQYLSIILHYIIFQESRAGVLLLDKISYLNCFPSSIPFCFQEKLSFMHFVGENTLHSCALRYHIQYYHDCCLLVLSHNAMHQCKNAEEKNRTITIWFDETGIFHKMLKQPLLLFLEFSFLPCGPLIWVFYLLSM